MADPLQVADVVAETETVEGKVYFIGTFSLFLVVVLVTVSFRWTLLLVERQYI